MLQVDNLFVSVISWLLIIYVVVSLIYSLASLILFLANIVMQKYTGQGFLQPEVKGGLQLFFERCENYMINPCFLVVSGIAYLAYSFSISFGWLSKEMATVAIINAPLIILVLFSLVLIVGNIVTPRTGMGKDMPSIGIAIITVCLLIAAGLTYLANSVFKGVLYPS